MKVTKLICKILIVYFFITDRYWFYQDFMIRYGEKDLNTLKHELGARHQTQIYNQIARVFYVKGDHQSSSYNFYIIPLYDITIAIAVFLISFKNYVFVSFLVYHDSFLKILFCFAQEFSSLEKFNFMDLTKKFYNVFLNLTFELLRIISKDFLLCINFGLISLLFILCYQLDKEFLVPTRKVRDSNCTNEIKDITNPQPSVEPTQDTANRLESFLKDNQSSSRPLTPSKRREIRSNF